MKRLAWIALIVAACTPARPAGVAAVSGHRIAAGEGHACVIASDETVWCWGRDAFAAGSEKGPAQVRGLQGARSLFAADAATCAITARGVSCWGDDLFGQVRMRAEVAYVAVPEPWILPGGTVARAGALGPRGGCTVEAGAVTCWGDVNFRSSTTEPGTRFGLVPLGGRGKNGISGSQTTPPHRVEGIDGAVQVAFGLGHLCALIGDGTVRCLGENLRGELGRPDVGESRTQASAQPVSGLEATVQLEAWTSTTCALDRRGAVRCWGSDADGQLGVRDASALTPFTGLLRPDPHDRFSDAPLRVEGLPPVRTLSVGAAHACAVGEDRRVYCWGDNDAGQLGDGTTERRDVPIVMPGVSGAVDVAVGKFGPKSFTCVLLEGGAVRCVGTDEHGELGGDGKRFSPPGER